jgi:putative phosphoribosyl transferase
VAHCLHEVGLGSLLADLLTERELADRRDVGTDIRLLTRRLVAVTHWVATHPPTRGLALGYHGASTGAAAALRAAAELGDVIGAVVSRGGRPDLAADRLAAVAAPTLLVVGGRDPEVLELNRQASARMRAPCEVTVVDGAGHLFAEPGVLRVASRLAAGWFSRHLRADVPAATG